MKKKNKLLAIILSFCVLISSSDVTVMAKSYEPPKGSAIEIVEVMPVTEPIMDMEVIEEIEVVEVIEKPEPEKTKNKNLGKFKITYYCACESCSGGWGNMTATGVRAKEGRTIAVDPKVIPYGTKVVINGHEYIAEDCGGAIKGKKIDIFIEDHDRAYEYGVDYYNVYVMK